MQEKTLVEKLAVPTLHLAVSSPCLISQSLFGINLYLLWWTCRIAQLLHKIMFAGRN